MWMFIVAVMYNTKKAAPARCSDVSALTCSRVWRESGETRSVNNAEFSATLFHFISFHRDFILHINLFKSGQL